MEYWTMFLIGFLSSFGHCIGMCGGFVTAYTMQIHARDASGGILSKQMITPHLLYNGGRILTYTCLGFLFGLAGESLRLIIGIHQIQGVLQTIAGVLMILIALDMGGWIPPLLSDKFPGYSTFKRIIGALLKRVNRSNVFGLGITLGFIPCGLVYAAGAKAASTGTPVDGMLIMLSFGLGTVPAMLAVGFGANVVSANIRSTLFKLATVLVMVLGVLTTVKGFQAIVAPPGI